MADVNILIDVVSKNAVKELDKLEKEFGNLEKDAKKAGEESDKAFSLMSKGAAAAAIAVAGIGAGIVKSIQSAAKFQSLETQFISFTGSAESAANQVERIAEFSGQTPFQVEDLANANRTLLAFGSSTEQSFTQLKQLGEAAAATGNNIGELAQIFGQIQVAGKLTGERFNQLAERGVNLGPALAKGLGVAETELEDLRKKGQITSEDVAKAFASMTEGGGQFAGAMERLSTTFDGATSTLGDNIDLLAADLGKLLLPVVTDVVVGMTDVVKAIRQISGTSKEKITVTSEMEKLSEQIRITELNASDLQKSLDKLDTGDKLDQKKFSEVNAELEKTNRVLEDQIKAFTRLKQARQLGESRERDANEAANRAKLEAEAEAKRQADAETRANAIAATEKKLAADILIIDEQLAANRRNVAISQSDERILFLQEEADKLAEKRLELESQRLETQGQFDEAIEVRAQAHEDRLTAIKQQADQERIISARQRSAEELDLAKIESDEKIKFEQKTNLEKARALKDGLSNLVALQNTGSKEAFAIGKAAALAQAAIAIPESALQAYKSGVGIGGPPLGAAFAAAATVAQVARLRQIQASKFTGFAEGGVVTGGTPGRDSVPALLTPGEVVVPEKNFADIGMNNEETNRQLMRLNSNIEEQNQVLFNISANTGDTARGTQDVVAGVANIVLPGQNNPGAGSDYTDWNIEAYIILNRFLEEQKNEQLADEFATETISAGSATPGQAQVAI